MAGRGSSHGSLPGVSIAIQRLTELLTLYGELEGRGERDIDTRENLGGIDLQGGAGFLYRLAALAREQLANAREGCGVAHQVLEGAILQQRRQPLRRLDLRFGRETDVA